MPELPTALKTACATGDLSLTKTLYNDMISTDPSAKTATLSQMAILSSKYSHSPILAFCFSEGLKLDTEKVNDPLIYAASDSGSVAIFRVLLDNGLDANEYQEMGSPLVSTCYSGNVELATFLLDHGADPNSGYPLGDYECLVWAIVGDHASLEMVKLLLTRGTVVKGTGALIAAAEYGNLGAIKVLLETVDVNLEEVEEYGAADPRKEDDMGTALYKAAAGGHAEIVDTLLGRGADERFKDKKGRSVADVAEENGHGDIARRLR